MTGSQLRFSVGTAHSGRLFPDNFLTDRLPRLEGFADLEVGELRRALHSLWERERDGLEEANEAQTEERFIRPCLQALGFVYNVQPELRFAGGRRQPDYTLFLDDTARQAAAEAEGRARFSDAAAVLDAKRFNRPLDVRRVGGALSEDPVAQIIHYIQATRCPWGILTNGRHWRLYALEGDLVEAACYEVDLVDLLERDDDDLFRYFAAFFAAGAFYPDSHGRSFLDRALADGAANARELGEGLENQVFAAVPLIAKGLIGEAKPEGGDLAEALENSLVLLYRLLFCLHAEARDLLPVNEPHYFPYSIREQKERLAAEIDSGRRFSLFADELYNELRALFRIIDRGDPRLGVNEYDGGLFASDRHPYFEGRSIPDDLLAPALDGLYRIGTEFIDYRSLSVRHLGTIYERLLEYQLVLGDDGELTLERSEGRRSTGSYFTPEPVVDLIVERTLEPILERRSAEVAARGESGEEALDSFLELNVLDPAMGSGHFLVSAASYIALFIATDPNYDGELDRIDIRRLVAERCLFGVDLNPMAVELARLALWLVTVKGDEPLTFLGNLRHGNSLVGADIEEMLAGEGDLFAASLAQEAEQMLGRIGEIVQLPGSTGEAVHEKERLAGAVAALREPLEEADNQHTGRFEANVGRHFHWQIEFPQVFFDTDGQLLAEGGFDAIVGNPPYIRIQALGREMAQYCRDRYEVAHGSFDAYIVFIERCIYLLAPAGRLGFITPSKFTKLESGSRLRDLLASGGLVEQIIDFGDTQLFAGATNYTAVVILDRDGRERLTYVRPDPEIDSASVMQGVEAAETQPYDLARLDSRPWVLAAGDEADVLETAANGSVPLEEVTEAIFTGLQTGADPIYILEDRGPAGNGGRRVWCREDETEYVLESDLLHRLASGSDVGRYAFRALDQLIIFPYERGSGGMVSLSAEQLEHLPLTYAFLRSHEDTLRTRERGRMDREGWWEYTRTQSLGRHDSPKLGVPRLCSRLQASLDHTGHVYLDNVDVNGIVPNPEAISITALLGLLNSRLLDFLFRRGSVPFRGQYLSANKQFIAPLPIRVPASEQARVLEEFGECLHRRAAAINGERRDFLRWLKGEIGVDPSRLPGQTRILSYEHAGFDDWFAILQEGVRRRDIELGGRAFRERVEAEWNSSMEKLTELRKEQAADERSADELIFDLYAIPARLQGVVDSEYGEGKPER